MKENERGSFQFLNSEKELENLKIQMQEWTVKWNQMEREINHFQIKWNNNLVKQKQSFKNNNHSPLKLIQSKTTKRIKEKEKTERRKDYEEKGDASLFEFGNVELLCKQIKRKLTNKNQFKMDSHNSDNNESDASNIKCEYLYKGHLYINNNNLPKQQQQQHQNRTMFNKETNQLEREDQSTQTERSIFLQLIFQDLIFRKRIITFQRLFREKQRMKKMKYENENGMALKIQNCFRKYQTSKRIEKRRKTIAATKIQCLFRIYSARKELDRRKKKLLKLGAAFLFMKINLERNWIEEKRNS
eukprot:TRINITY_DN3457_c0_g1_i2.p1 TRINITY_DN3457_c0_g1~~TRINITY_DN3457_c0_g1_i2.p1  ORF type:complete len:301 (+),score=85.39 TRINITY_DN3457_c0_g1_i2:169-1071(+)